MYRVRVKAIGVYRNLLGRDEVTLNFSRECTVRDVLESLRKSYRQLENELILTNNGVRNSLVLLNDTEISALDGLSTKIKDGDTLILLPTLHGGSEEVVYEVPSWDYLHHLLINLADKIKQSNFKPDIIIGVARGGWPPARILSDLLDNPNIASIKVEFYLDIYKTMEAPAITQYPDVDIRNKRILVVDDVADSGRSLQLVRSWLLEKGASEVRICTIYYKPWSVIKPDYYAKETKAWVIFTWEIKESIKKIAKKLLESGYNAERIKEKLIEIGISPLYVNKFVGEAVE